MSKWRVMEKDSFIMSESCMSSDERYATSVFNDHFEQLINSFLSGRI